MREYLLGELRHANDRTRIEAKNWIKEEEKKRKMSLLFKGVIRKAVAQAKNPPRPKHAETVPDLHAAMNKRLDAIVAALEQQSMAATAQERKIAAIQQALEPLLPSSSQNNTPYQKSRRASKSKVVDSAGAGSSGSCAGSDQPERKRSASCGNLATPQAGMDC